MNTNEYDTMNNDQPKEVIYIPTGLVDETVQFEPKDKPKKSDTLFLYFIVITVDLLVFVKGCSIVWTSPVIPQLLSNSSDVNPLSESITSGQISMLGGIPSIFLVLGTLLFGKVPDIIGRKNTLISISFLCLLSNLAMALFGTSIYVYIVGRSAIKLVFGFLLTVLPIYINEICEDHNRAKHGCLMMFFLPLGSLYAYLVGPVTSVRWFTLLCAAPLVPQILILTLEIPESPIHTCARGDKAETIKILKKLRSNKSAEDILQDYLEIEATLETRNQVVGGTLKKLFETRALKMGTLIGFVVCLTTHLAGVPVVMSYLAPIFNDANTNLSGNQVAILVGVVKLLFSFVTVVVVEKFGRRPLLLISCMGTVVSLLFLGVYFYLNAARAPIVDSVRWLPILAILFYISFYSLGMGSIPFSLLSELFPNDIRSTGSCFVMTVEGIFMIIIVTLFPILSESLGVHYCMGMFGVGCLICFVFMYFFLPETRGKSFLEIQNLLDK